MTEAGRSALRFLSPASSRNVPWEQSIIEIEREARDSLRAELRAAVEGLTSWPRVSWFAYDAHLRDGTPVNPTEDRVVVDRADVLRLLGDQDA